MIFVTFFFAFMERVLEGILLVRDETCFLGSPGRMRHPFVVENRTTELVTPRTCQFNFLRESSSMKEQLE